MDAPFPQCVEYCSETSVLRTDDHPVQRREKGALMELKCRHRGRRKPILGAVPHSCISVILENTLNQQKNLWSVLQPHNVNHTGSHWPASRQ